MKEAMAGVNGAGGMGGLDPSEGGPGGDGAIPPSVEEDRRHLVEATIVRIMKSRRTLAHNDLIAEVTKQLANRFSAQPAFIKRRVSLGRECVLDGLGVGCVGCVVLQPSYAQVENTCTN
jgi:cullin 3